MWCHWKMLTQMKSSNKYMYHYQYVIQFVLFILFNFLIKSENPYFICNYIERGKSKITLCCFIQIRNKEYLQSVWSIWITKLLLARLLWTILSVVTFVQSGLSRPNIFKHLCCFLSLLFQENFLQVIDRKQLNI